MMKKIAVGMVAFAVIPSISPAAIKTEIVTYKVGEKTYKGFLAFDDAIKEKRPGILVVHEFWGLNDYAKKRAEQLAEPRLRRLRGRHVRRRQSDGASQGSRHDGGRSAHESAGMAGPRERRSRHSAASIRSSTARKSRRSAIASAAPRRWRSPTPAPTSPPPSASMAPCRSPRRTKPRRSRRKS